MTLSNEAQVAVLAARSAVADGRHVGPNTVAVLLAELGDGVTDAQIEAALLRLDADVRQRLRIFDGGPELLSWENAHRLHRGEPYIGCPFCHDRFEVVPPPRWPVW